jgi:hypothetical protein
MTDYSWSITHKYNMASRTLLFEGCLLWPGDDDSFCLTQNSMYNKVVCSLKGRFFHHIAAKTRALLMPNFPKNRILSPMSMLVNDTLWQKASITDYKSILLMGPWLLICIVRVYSTPRLVLFSLFLCRCQRRDLEKNLNLQNPICYKQVKRGNWFATKYFYFWFPGPLCKMSCSNPGLQGYVEPECFQWYCSKCLFGTIFAWLWSLSHIINRIQHMEIW